MTSINGPGFIPPHHLGTAQQPLDVASESGSDPDNSMVRITMTPNQLRRKIRTFLDNGGMKVTEFTAALGVSGPGYYRFMNQNGNTKGAQSDVYVQAHAFFQKRERKGLPMPKKKPAPKAATSRANAPLAEGNGNQGSKRKHDADKETTEEGQAKKSRTTKGNSENGADSYDVSHIQLEGEPNDEVEVYDSCDEIRRKISRHLNKPGVTKASFLRDLSLQYHKNPRKLQGAQLDSFRSKHGAESGNTSGIFYAAYVFFEKLRLKEKKPKSAHRLDMERALGVEGGFETKKVLANTRYIVSAGSYVYHDNLGKPHVGGRH